VRVTLAVIAYIFLTAPVFASCPHELEVTRHSAEPRPSQSVFFRHGPYLDYFTTADGEEVMFGAVSHVEGRVLTLRQIVVRPSGAPDYHTRVLWSASAIRRALNQLKEKAKRAGFAVLVLEGDRVTGGQKKNTGESWEYRRVLLLERP